MLPCAAPWAASWRRGPCIENWMAWATAFCTRTPGYDFFKGFSRFGTVTGPSFGPFGLSLFEEFLVERSNLRFIDKLVRKLLGWPNDKSERMNAFLRHATKTKIYQERTPPFFFYTHILAPHPPFTIDRWGQPIDIWRETFGDLGDGDHATRGDPALQAQYQAGYVEKLRFINKEILRQATDMIRTVPAPKIIVIHGDHGSGSQLFQNDPGRSCLKERMSPFFAIYADDPRLREAFANYRSSRFNLVNLYRLIFDATFGTDLGALDDRSFFLEWDRPKHPQRLSDETIVQPCVIPGR